MSAETWGMMPKSQIDAQTINNAIDVAVAAHESDHPADSVITDKIPENTIDPRQLFYDRLYFATDWESIDFLDITIGGNGTVTNKLGYLKLNTGTISVRSVYASSFCEAYALNFDQGNPVFETILKIDNFANGQLSFGIGDWSDKGTNFRIQSNVITARWASNGNVYYQVITGIDPTLFHHYKIKVTSGEKIEFFIDHVLVYTATTNIPTGNTSAALISFISSSYSSTTAISYILRTVFYQDVYQ
jgi:hypothetical protein